MNTELFRLHEVPKVVKLIKSNRGIVVARSGGGGRNGELLNNGNEISVKQDEYALEIYCTTLYLSQQ